MKLNLFNQSLPIFKGRREDRNIVNQLQQDNNYSLTENNQLRINKAIDNLSKESGENNVKFLIEVAENLKYGTNIDLGKKSKNGWKMKLHEAAEKSLAISEPILQAKLKPEINRVFNSTKELNQDEKDILSARENILSKLDLSQLDDEKNPNIKNVESNLDYFIASSETPTKQKKYVLNRLDYFLSPEYEINSQLENKKTKVFAEMINDLVVDTPESKVPNTKAINQKRHGMCAAISIARKLMSYEDKPNYVDNLLSELDSSPHIMVYDKTQLGKGKRVPVNKAQVDFVDAEKKGYRIVDASTTQWMNIGGMYDSNSTQKYVYVPFDRENFGAMQDNHFMLPIQDENLITKQIYYQALLQSKEAVGAAKKSNIKDDISRADRKNSFEKDLNYLQKINNSLKSQIKEIAPSLSDKEVFQVSSDLLKLRKNNSAQIDKLDTVTKKYNFIPNEEASMKNKKVKAYLSDVLYNKVDSEKLEKSTPEIVSLIETSVGLQNGLYAKTSKGITHARKMFEAAAAYRNHVITSLDDKDYKTDRMIKHNIPDAESLLSDNIDKTIKHIEKTNDKRYIKHFAPLLGTSENKNEITEVLSSLKQGVDASITTGLDESYRALGFKNRKEALLSQVSGVKNLITSGDKETINEAAFSMGIKPDKSKLIKEYTKFEETLINGASDKEYTEIFNKIGYKNQMQAYADLFNIVVNAMNNPEDEVSKEVIATFNKANNLPDDTPLNVSRAQLANISNNFNNLSLNLGFVRDLMTIVDEDGEILNTADTTFTTIKAIEKTGEIIPFKELVPLRDRFDKIDKLRSQDEFSSRQGKISDPSLNKLSIREKETVRKIDKSLNKMYSEINKEMAFVIGEIRKPLEEHGRKIGVSTGDYWASLKTGGMHTEQEIKILQQMTDKKYHSVQNIEKGVDKIKKSPYSGISASSVFHNKLGMHAQYIAEVSQANNKDILYHDNSWGACENENTWVDFEGLHRTDYSDVRGGELGYITNQEYRNGNYVENLIYKGGEVVEEKVENKQLKKFSEGLDGHKFPIMRNILLQGSDSKVNDIAFGIHDNLFIPGILYFNILVSDAQNMSKKDIKGSIDRHMKAGENYHKELENIDKRIYSTPFNKGIETEEDYLALADNDPIKVNFEKVALMNSFPNAVDWKKLAKADTVSQIHDFKQERYKNAKSYFDYSFAKDSKILNLDSLSKIVNGVTDVVLDKYNIKLDEKSKNNILNNINRFEKNDNKMFDGSLKNTINFMVDKATKQFGEVVQDETENTKLAKQEFQENLTKALSDAYYINESDVDNHSTKFKAIANYIDKKYNPETNEDFVNIYRKLQDMTKEEFDQETSDLTEKDLGIKEYSGFDMLRRYKASDLKTTERLRNTLFQHELLKDINLSETEPSWNYHKLYKHTRGAIYVNGKTFDDIYRDYAFSLQALEYQKMFNKYKDINLKKYGAVPAYPKMSVLDDELLKKKIDGIDELTYGKFQEIDSKRKTLRAYEISDSLEKAINSIPDDSKLSKKHIKKINRLAGEFVTIAYNDKAILRSLNAAQDILSLDKNAKGIDYKNAYKPMAKEFAGLKQLNSADTLQNAIDADIKVLNLVFDSLIKGEISEKHQNDLKHDVNNWLKAELKADGSRNAMYKQIGKLDSKFMQYNTGKKSFAMTKAEYMESLEDSLSTLNKIKTAGKVNAEAKELNSKKLTELLGNTLLNMVPENNQDDFAKFVISMATSNQKLAKQDVLDGITIKLAEYSIPTDDIQNNQSIKKIANSIIKLNTNVVMADKLANNFADSFEEIHGISDKFVAGHIKPEYQQAVRQSIGDILQTTLVDQKDKFDEVKVYDAHEKFVSDFKKYHVLNYPVELLNSVLLLNAKDSKIHSKDEKDKNEVKRMTSELNLKSNYLASALAIAELLEMQGYLMDAVSTGNATDVAKKFEDHPAPLRHPKTHEKLTMADSLAIDYMVRKMIVNDNDETAIMFIDKLGLAKKFLEAQNEILNLDAAKKDVRRMVSILGTTNSQANIVKDAVKVFENPMFDNDADYAKKIDDVKNEIIEKSSKLPRKKAIKTYLKAFDNAKEFIDANPNLSKRTIIFQSLNSALSEVGKMANDDVGKIQDGLNSYSTMYNLANKLTIPDYSDAKPEFDKFVAKYKEYEKYNNDMIIKTYQNGSEYMDVKIEKR